MSSLIGIVGSGIVGRSWATLFAKAGYEVRIFDSQSKAAAGALPYIEGMLALFETNGLIDDRERASAIARVAPVESLSEAVGDAGYIQECVPERVDIKREVTAAIAELARPDAVIASSTSGIVPSAFTADVAGRQRCLVTHPINPVHLHTLVEIVPAPWTAEASVNAAVALLTSAGMQPVRLTREVDGFLVNRLQSAVLHEAFRLVGSGVATAADVDAAIRAGLAPRWSLMGPFETIDLNAPCGIADYVERYEPMYQGLAAQQVDTVDWSEVLSAGLLAQRRTELPLAELEDRRKWRDAKLMDLLRFWQRP